MVFQGSPQGFSEWKQQALAEAAEQYVEEGADDPYEDSPAGSEADSQERSNLISLPCKPYTSFHRLLLRLPPSLSLHL